MFCVTYQNIKHQGFLKVHPNSDIEISLWSETCLSMPLGLPI